MSTAATVFTLFLVTYGADVKHSTYDSLKSCQEAKSLALYGQTIEQKAAQDKMIADAEKERQAKLDAEHPWRDPQNEQERKWVKYGYEGLTVADDMCGLKQESGSFLVVRRSCTVEVRDGKIRYVPETQYSLAISGSSIEDRSIKTAECVVVPEPKP